MFNARLRQIWNSLSSPRAPVGLRACWAVGARQGGCRGVSVVPGLPRRGKASPGEALLERKVCVQQGDG